MDRTEVLKNKIISLGLRSGYDMETNELVIISQGYACLGRINHTRQFHVELNKHFDRQVTGDTKKALYEAINVFVNTSMEEKENDQS